VSESRSSPGVVVLRRPSRDLEFLGVDVEPIDVVEDALGHH